tara:strand:- start:37 stop:1812 length:1776 start_codon:yes stop_codon:yes gene_type:complete
MNFRKIILLNTLLTFFSLTHASETLNPIVVGNSISPIDIHTSPASIEVLTSSDIETRGFADMQELLNSISSINITSNGGIGQTTSIFTRGTESNHTKIILDGVELNPGTLALAPIQNISIDSIDKIEIIKGSSSALHGARTIGGIINIKTKENSNSIKISTGSWSTNTTSLSQNYDLNGFKMNINANRKESKSKTASQYSNKRHAYNTDNISVGMSKEINDYVFSTRLYNSNGNTQYDNFGTNENQDHDDYFYNFSLKKFISDDIFEMKIIGSQNRIIQKRLGSNDFTDTLRDIYDFSYTNVGSNVVQKIGVIYSKEHMSELVYGGTAYESRFTAQHNNKEYFYQSELSYPSYRINYGLRHTDHSRSGHFNSGNFGLSFLSGDDVYSFNLTKSYRPADATDLYATDGSGDAARKPEESFSYELGIKRYVNESTFIRGTAFKTRIKNLIEADENSQIYISDALITGLEMRVQTNIHPFKYDIGYTYMIPRDTKNNQPLTKRAKHKLNADLIYKINQNSDFRFNILGVGTVKASSIRDINLGSYYIANANYRKKLDQGTISLSMKNIFDRPYRTAHRYHTLDRSLFVTYTLDY